MSFDLKGFPKRTTVAITAVIAVMLVVSVYLGTGTSTISGTWTVVAYQLDGEYIPASELAGRLGGDAQQYAGLTLIFDDSGNLEYRRQLSGADGAASTQVRQLHYTVRNYVIEVSDAQEQFELFTLKDNQITVPLTDDLSAILEKEGAASGPVEPKPRVLAAATGAAERANQVPIWKKYV